MLLDHDHPTRCANTGGLTKTLTSVPNTKISRAIRQLAILSQTRAVLRKGAEPAPRRRLPEESGTRSYRVIEGRWEQPLYTRATLTV